MHRFCRWMHVAPLVLVLLALTAVAVGADEFGSVTFYSQKDFKGDATRMIVDGSDMCFNIPCFEDKARSIMWADINGDNSRAVERKNTSIAFFSDAGCTGKKKEYSTHPLNSPAELGSVGLDRDIASFIWYKRERPSQPMHDLACPVVDTKAEEARAIDFAGSVTLHSLPYLGGNKSVVPVTQGQLCYNIELPGNMAVESAQWSNMADWSTVNSLNISQMLFYADSDCRGMRRRYASNVASAFTLRKDGLLVVKSFMLEQYTSFAVKGTTKPSLSVDKKKVELPAFDGTMTFVDSKAGDSLVYRVNKVETCYNIGCFASRATDVTWNGLPFDGRTYANASAVAFYAETDCKRLLGAPYRTAAGQANFNNGNEPYKRVVSFMIWSNANSSATPPVDDKCIDRPRTSAPVAKEMKSSLSWLWWLLGTVAVLAVLGAAGWFIWKRKFSSKSDEGAEKTIENSAPRMCDLDTDGALRDIRIPANEVIIDGVLGTTETALLYQGRLKSEVVMVKKLFPERAQDEDAKQLLIYEAKLASQLDHPKIVRFLGVCWTLQSDVGSVYELVDGGDLATFLRTNRRALSWAKASSKDGSSLPTKLQLAIDIAEALVLLHSFYPPISHGNLTTKSVVVTASGVAKVWNFRPVGLLGVADPDASDRGIVHSDISAFGALLVELDWCEPADTHFDEKSVPMLSTSCPRVVAQLARRCLSTTAAEHPSALEAVFELRRAAATLVESETESDERLSSSSE